MKNPYLSTHTPQLTTIFRKTLAIATALSILLQALYPNNAFASVTGPSQPEFSSFQSVGTDGMINTFTGDFSYSLPVLQIPGTEGGGYALSLSYNSSVGVEEEASWVGYGWTLNAGAIIRNKQGFADDVDKGTLTYFNKMKRNWTVAAGVSSDASVRVFGVVLGSAGFSSVIQYNNYKGLSTSTIPYVSYQLGLQTTTHSSESGSSESGGESRTTYSYANPMSIMIGMAGNELSKSVSNLGQQYGICKEVVGAVNLGVSRGTSMLSGQYMSSSQYAAYTLASKYTSIPSPSAEYASAGSWRVSLGAYATPSPLPIGIGASVFGTYNYQTTKEEADYKYCGYLYSHNAVDTEDENENGLENDVMMDYHVERPDNFNPHDEILSTPFSSPDMFNVVGEGLSGVMRLYSSKIGEFHPNEVINSSGILELGVHVSLGPLCPGVSTSPPDVGNYSLSLNKWDDDIDGNGVGENDEFDFSDEGNEAYFFRFLGDMGGHLSMASPNGIEAATMIGFNDGYSPQLSSSCNQQINNGKVVGRSSYIGYHTVSQMKEKDSQENNYKRYSQRDDIASLINTGSDNGIGEFAITNKQGNKYVYALPIYAKDEDNISVDVKESDLLNGENYLAYRNISNPDNIETKLGQHIQTKYASMYLLTEILSPNYIDVNGNGPDKEDIGGWTRFNYTKKYGDNGTADPDYFKWRAPWKGLIYNERQLSNPDDDLGTYSSGKKEICYLESIETSTHIAIFETSVRKDGYEAEGDNDAANNAIDIATGNKKLEKLDKITLYAKDSDGNAGEIISTVHFDYNYSLQLGQPNNINSYTNGVYSSGNANSGKLTLTKVWFEYGGVLNANISPYEFVYKYPKTTGNDAVDYPLKNKYIYNDADPLNLVLSESFDEYAEFENYGNGLNENPVYDEANIDAWGNYRANGQERVGDMENWVDQTPETDALGVATDFDPAAYKLKRIKLPTEAEIHVQYESDQYSFVQDRRASVMVPISGYCVDCTSGNDGAGSYGSKYYLNLDGIGANTESDTVAIMDWIEKIYIDGHRGRDPEKMYFKFKYNVLKTCGYEYISGYANVMDVGIETDVTSEHKDKIYVQLGNPGVTNPEIVGFSSPYDACLEYFNANKGMDANPDCGSVAMIESANDDAEGMVLQIIEMIVGVSEYMSSPCLDMNTDESYLRIPVPAAKKGGGVRVKRLLRYDKGLESNNEDAALYGTEYIYETIEGRCSGVAANEPGGIREENALITYLKKRSKLTSDEVLAAGEDNSQFEGPIGESVLPGAAVGYSRVISRNIHSGSTNNGFSTAEYYTTFDYPFDRVSHDAYSGVSYTDLVLGDSKIIDQPEPTFGFFTNKTSYSLWASQGFKFVINNMNGQPKKMTHYEGDYNLMNDFTQVTELSSTSYQYFKPGEKLPVMDNHYTFGVEALGQEVEVVTESRFIHESNSSNTIMFDAGTMIWGLLTIPYTYALVFSTKDETKLKTHVTNKIIYAPSAVKSVTNYKDGIYTTLTNKYFDPLTGDPVVQEQSGLFDQHELVGDVAHEGKYISFNYMASSYYGGMGQKAGCENFSIEATDDAVLNFVDASVGLPTYDDPDYILFSGDYCEGLEKLTCGDLIAIHSSDVSPSIAQVSNIKEDTVYVIATSNFSYAGGSPDGDCSIEILQSNRANLLSVGAGNTVMYGSFEEADGLYDPAQDVYKDDLVAYLTDKANSVTVTEPTTLDDISVINPINGNCSQCKLNPKGALPFDCIWDDLTEECLNEIEFVSGYEFFIDDETGNMMYGDPDNTCSATELSCIQFCNTNNPDNIISSNAVKFTPTNDLDEDLEANFEISGNDNPFETGQRGKWHVKSTYNYKTDISSIYDDVDQVYQAGVFNDYTPFNWANPDRNDEDKWQKLSTTNIFSVDGKPLEEKNSMDIYSVAKYGYDNKLNYLVAYNAEHESVLSESFEYEYTDKDRCQGGPNSTCFEEMGINTTKHTLVSTQAHSGEQSVLLGGFSNVTQPAPSCANCDVILSLAYKTELPLFQSRNITTQMEEKGFVVKMWVKSTDSWPSITLEEVLGPSLFTTVSFAEVARVGDWKLYEAKVTDWNLSGETEFKASIVFSLNGTPNIANPIPYNPPTESVYVDDIRMQPLDAKMSTYVYDPATFKVSAQFDNQHFGTYYQYSKEGKLLRISRETERGLKMVKETQYNIPTSSR